MYVRYNLKASIICKINLKYAKNITQHINIVLMMHKINIQNKYKKNINLRSSINYTTQKNSDIEYTNIGYKYNTYKLCIK